MHELASNTDGLILDPGVFYDGGRAKVTARNMRKLSLLAYRFGWHNVEDWGCWSSDRDSQLRFRSVYDVGVEVLVAVQLHAPDGGDGRQCEICVGGAPPAAPTVLTRESTWYLAKGAVSHRGVIKIDFRCVGDFAPPDLQGDTRNLYVGFHAIAYCRLDDKAARAALEKKAEKPETRPAGGLGLNLKRRFSRPAPDARTLDALAQIQRQADGEHSDAIEERVAHLERAAFFSKLAPELAGLPEKDLYQILPDTIEVRQLGRDERTYWGKVRTLRGVESIRGYLSATTPILELQILIDGQLVDRSPLKGGYPFPYATNKDAIRKYVFHAWVDFSHQPFGRHALELRFVDGAGGSRSRQELVVIAEPLLDTDYPSSNRIVTVKSGGAKSVETKVNELPSAVRPASRSVFERPPRNVLVVRADQLGDMVCSVPAVRRLRELLPEARLVGMLSSANEELARSLGLFDEIIVVDFPDDPVQRRRLMQIEQQSELRKRLLKYDFDIAMDMSESGVSRPLLQLSGARFLYGFSPGEFKWLSSAFEVQTHDYANALECAPQSTKLLGFVEWLGTLLKSHARVERRSDLRREILQPFGVDAARFALLHAGARLNFSRWPYYGELAKMFLDRTDYKVVLMFDDADSKAQIAAAVVNSPRVQCIPHRVSFDELDALVTFCDVFVGNDSGPKHLAGLRGANVVSIHCARNNWNEWGQETGGFIISRRVPCAGCSIHHYPEDCGKGFPCVTQISPQEVFDAARKLFEGGGKSSAAHRTA